SEEHTSELQSRENLVCRLLLEKKNYLSFTKKRTLNVKTSELLIKEVKQDFFEDFIVFQAKTDPLHSMLINVIEGGSVQEVFVEFFFKLDGGHRVLHSFPTRRSSD